MKRKKYIPFLIMFLMISLFLLDVVPTYAMEEDENLKQQFTIQKNYIIDEFGVKYSNFYDSMGNEVSLEEALAVLNENTNIYESLYLENGSRAAVPVVDTIQINTINQKYVGEAQKVTPDVEYPLELSYSVSNSVSSSVTGAFSATVKNLIFQKVDVSVGVTISKETAITQTTTVTVSPSEGKIGAIWFKPYYVRAVGTYTPDDYSPSQSFIALYPRKTSTGFADGLYYLVEY